MTWTFEEATWTFEEATSNDGPCDDRKGIVSGEWATGSASKIGDAGMEKESALEIDDAGMEKGYASDGGSTCTVTASATCHVHVHHHRCAWAETLTCGTGFDHGAYC